MTEYVENLSDYDYGDLMTVEEFAGAVKCHAFIDYDGFGYPVKDDKVANEQIQPSTIHLMPEDATHILWMNR